MEVQTSKGLSLSLRQFEVLCSMIRRAPDPEAEARRLSLMQNHELMALIGEKSI